MGSLWQLRKISELPNTRAFFYPQDSQRDTRHDGPAGRQPAGWGPKWTS